MSVEVGSKAPDFTLKDQDFRDVRLSDFRGRTVVLVFFPFAFSSVCSTENRTFSGDLERYHSFDAEVLGISVDSPYALKAFAKSQNIEHPLLSDFNREVSKAYGVLHDEIKDLREVPKRAIFIRDADGIVQYRWVSDDSRIEPDYDAVISEAERISARASARGM
jgi:peroxiredoxin